eukprot:6193662-Pleurochrysis_carterae.AAC.2
MTLVRAASGSNRGAFLSATAVAKSASCGMPVSPFLREDGSGNKNSSVRALWGEGKQYASRALVPAD